MNENSNQDSKEQTLEGDSALLTLAQNTQFANSTLNDREAGAVAQENKPIVGNEANGNFQPSYGHIWQDVDGDYSSDDESPENADGALLNKIRVIVRVRPLIQGESTLAKRNQSITSGQMMLDPGNESISLKFDSRNKQPQSFGFDKVCDGLMDQRTFYQAIGVKGMIRQVVNGYHGTIFAYGQTGAGKTYTMEGYKYMKSDKGTFEPQIEQAMATNNVGLVQRCTRQLMKSLSKRTGDRRLTVNISFLQLYNEKIYDLLNRDMFKPVKKDKIKLNMGKGDGLKLKWNQYDVYTVENLLNVECESVDEILHLFHYGLQNKNIGSHRMNMTSSRSHTILSITVEQTLVSNPDNTIISKLQIVDLAGSERQSLTKTEGIAQKESIEINKSLFTLRKVISALTDRTIK